MRTLGLLFLSLLVVGMLFYSESGDAAENAGTKFTFVVMGDSRPPGYARDKITPPAVFFRIIDQINLLQPDFVVHTGDMIMGTPPRDVEAQWEAFQKAVVKFEMPCYLAYGNHDIKGPLETRERVVKRKSSWHSFNHKGSHFIILDSEGAKEGGKFKRKISPSQLKWLKNDLEANKNAAKIFVFFHTPIWWGRYSRVGNWNQEVHQLMAKYKVDTVFSGHKHWYEKNEVRDGVRYIITAGGGAELKQNEGNGGFFHFMFVTVENGKAHLAVIREGGVVPEDVVTRESTIRSKKFMRTFAMPHVFPNKEKRSKVTIPIKFSNPFSEDITGILYYGNIKDCDWRLEPGRKIFLLKPGQKFETVFYGEVSSRKLFPPADIILDAKLGKEQLFKGPFPIRIDIHKELSASKVSVPPVVDGKLDDKAWKLAGRYGDFVDFRGSYFADPQTTVFLCYDQQNLYLGFYAQEPFPGKITADAEARDHWSFRANDVVSATLVIDKDTYSIMTNFAGMLSDRKNNNKSWNPELPLKTSKTDSAWIVELAIPFSELGVTPPESGARWKINF